MEDYKLLLNMRHYHDPTDFSVREPILNILLKDKQKSIEAIQQRIKNKMEWESDAYLEFNDLLARIKET